MSMFSQNIRMRDGVVMWPDVLQKAMADLEVDLRQKVVKAGHQWEDGEVSFEWSSGDWSCNEQLRAVWTRKHPVITTDPYTWEYSE